ncbi:tetratricopeptide repeat protein [Halomonas piscis]|uniref:Ancillary SecYEG translocon subunit n=1 Tax=Halomonas piscis TaxID=3031727 RepID=A0ABY9Z172_9GAMM|nr:tetratricopeptide repeat protein [Halomonas piscis]WNK20868.1 tetratricopeptide repeat protein [Halomonas piscis]
MAELRTEEEQLDAIKRWWKENGTSLIAGLVIAGAGVFGFKAWQNYQDGQAEAASLRYQQLIAETAGLNADESADEQALQNARSTAEELVDSHGGSLYAELALLLDARLAVQQDDLDGARASLEQALDASSRDYVQSLARLRLARLDVAAGEAQRALDRLDDNVADPLTAQRHNVRGDALLALERKDDARREWQQAQTLAEEQDQPLYGVALKLDDLGAKKPRSGVSGADIPEADTSDAGMSDAAFSASASEPTPPVSPTQGNDEATS